MKVIDFTPKPPKAEKKVKLPSEAETKELLGNSPLKAFVLVLVNEDDDLSYIMDGTNPMEAMGLMEAIKYTILSEPIQEFPVDE